MTLLDLNSNASYFDNVSWINVLINNFYLNFLVFPPPPPPAFLRDRMMDGFRDYDYYERHDEYARDMYERRYPPMIRSRDSRYMERPYPIPPMPRDYGPSAREMFTRRSPPRRGFGIYEDFSRDSFDDRRGGGMRGMSPTHRYAPY